MGKEIRFELLAEDIYRWCLDNDLWGDNTIYFNGKAWSNCPTWSGEQGKKIYEDLYEYADRKASTYFEYANDDTLSMSFEGPLYYVLNGYTRGWEKLEEEFIKLFERYDLLWEMGHAWNLAAFELR